MQRIENAFTKWMVRWSGRNRIPAQFAWYLQNVRIKNDALTTKSWARKLYTYPDLVQAICRYEKTDKLLVIANWELYANGNKQATINGSRNWDDEWNMVAHGDFVLIFNGIEQTRVYHVDHGLYRTDNSSGYEAGAWIQPPALQDDNAWSSVITPKPLVGARITWFSIYAGNDSVTKKVLYISHPVTPAEPYKAFDFSIPTGGQEYDIGENRYMSSDILWLESTVDNVYVFCRSNIEILGRKTVLTTWGITSLSSQRIGEWSSLAYHQLSCSVGDKVFFFTKTKKIMAISYTQGIENPQLDEHFSEPINDRLRLNISNNYIRTFAYYDEKEEQIEFHLKTDFAWDTPDIVVIYSLKYDSWLIDKDFAFSYLCKWWQNLDETYAAHDKYVYIDNRDGDNYYNWTENTAGTIQGIEAKYHTTNIAMGNEWAEKLFRWFIIAGSMNSLWEIIIRCFIDGDIQFSKTITRNDLPNSESSAVDTGDPKNYETTDTLYPFEYVVDQWKLRKKWKRIRLSIESSKAWCKFSIDTLFIDAVPTGNYELNDKF